LEAWLKPRDIGGGGVGEGKLAAESGGGGGGVMGFTWICSRLCWNLHRTHISKIIKQKKLTKCFHFHVQESVKQLMKCVNFSCTKKC